MDVKALNGCKRQGSAHYSRKYIVVNNILESFGAKKLGSNAFITAPGRHGKGGEVTEDWFCQIYRL